MSINFNCLINRPSICNKLIYIIGPPKPLDCELSEWSSWRNSDPQSDYYNPTSDEYPDYDYEIAGKASQASSGDYYEDPPITTECTCINIRTEGNETINELQFRRRNLVKEGTIGGKFCHEKTFEVQQCVCMPGEKCILS